MTSLAKRGRKRKEEMKYRSINDLLTYLKSIQNDFHIYIWGTGYYGSKLGLVLNDEEIKWDGYYDNFDVVKGKRLNNKRVLYGQRINTDKSVVYCIGTKELLANNIREQLLLAGVYDNNIFLLEGADIYKQIEERVSSKTSLEKEVTRFHNLYKGKKCFIIGNGPSLTMKDLEKISNEKIISFGSNYIFKCYNKTYWRPDYYVVVDTTAIRNILRDNEIIELISNNSKQIFTYNYSESYERVIQNLTTFNYVCSNENEEFSEDCAKKIYSGKTVTFAMLQIAVYMGFSEIYLLGMDHTFSTEVKEDGTVVHNNVEDHSKALECGNVSYFQIDEVTRAYRIAKEYADNHGIKIYNATRGGKLEVFERADFDKIF